MYKVFKKFHNLKLKVDHEFDLYKKLQFYEKLRTGKTIYRDYEQTKANVLLLKSIVNSYNFENVLTHIDAVPDNFLLFEQNGEIQIRLIDWEYSGMQDPLVDLAMFGIYAMYEEDDLLRLLEYYYPDGQEKTELLRFYCYISIAGLLWSNWCEYKRELGVDFGKYSIKQYRYAKEYYRKAIKLNKEMKDGYE